MIAKIFENNAERADHIDGEFAAIRSLRHERVASLLTAYKPSNSPVAVFILEKLQGADVLTYLATKHDYTEQTVATIVTQVPSYMIFSCLHCVIRNVSLDPRWFTIFTLARFVPLRFTTG